MIKEILKLLGELVSFPSVTPKGEDALIFIAEFLKPLGFESIIKTFGPENEVANLYAYTKYNFEASFNLCFAGHVDVVPPMEESKWLNNPFEMIVENDLVYGRGVVDMKGAIACAMIAVQQYLQNNKMPNGNISFLLTTDEEVGGKYGTQEMLKHIDGLGHKIDFCILGEPTSMNEIGDIIKIGRRGSTNFDLKIIGVQGHVAYPEKALNPNTILINILKELDNYILDPGSEFFQASNLEITFLNCPNKVNNIIPEMAEAKFNIRFNDHHSSESLQILVNEIVQKYSDNFDLKYTCGSLPFIQKVSENIQRFKKIVENSTKIESRFETNGGTSDARFLHKYAEVVEFGLKCDQAHKINENCAIGDLQTLYNVYYDSLIKFLSDS